MGAGRQLLTLLYYEYLKMIAVKMVFVRFRGKEHIGILNSAEIVEIDVVIYSNAVLFDADLLHKSGTAYNSSSSPSPESVRLYSPVTYRQYDD